jgi:hypothetical protein
MSEETNKEGVPTTASDEPQWWLLAPGAERPVLATLDEVETALGEQTHNELLSQEALSRLSRAWSKGYTRWIVDRAELHGGWWVRRRMGDEPRQVSREDRDQLHRGWECWWPGMVQWVRVGQQD